jgi:hypothetical protein
MAKKRKLHGHYCWCCGRMRPNEKFSGGGHARHLCKDCSRLGAPELQHRQDRRNLERLVTREGVIGRKKRKDFNRFLEHPDPRIRRYAEKLAALDIEARAMLRFLGEEDFCEPGGDRFEMDGAAAGESPHDFSSQDDVNVPDDDDIPF